MQLNCLAKDDTGNPQSRKILHYITPIMFTMKETGKFLQTYPKMLLLKILIMNY